MSPGSPLVSLSGVGVRVGATTILRDVGLSIDAGEIVGLFGANGAGKTTLLRVIATLLRPTEGTGTLLGVDLTSAERLEVRPFIGMIGHVPALYPTMTLGENLLFWARVGGRPEASADEALRAVGLGAARDRRADASSHGMQRRAEFARELMFERRLLLLDEPHSSLDPAAAELVEALVRRVADAGGAVVLVSHDRDRVIALADRSLMIDAGTVT